MATILPSNSRYKRTAQIRTADGKNTFGLMSGFDFLDPAKVGSRYFNFKVEPRHVHKPSMIALEYYGNESLYWVLVLFNAPRNIFRWPELGEIVRVPNRGLVIPEL